MKRISLVWLLATCFLATVSNAEGQQPAKTPRIGFLDSGAAADPENLGFREVFLQGLRDLGYIDGKNIAVEFRYDEGKRARLEELADELVRLKVDILMAMDTNAAQAAKKSTTTVPIIFTTGANPVGTGLVASFAHPGGNLTGVTTNSPELVGKRLGLLKEAIPKISRFGFLAPAAGTIKEGFDEAQPTAKVLGVVFQAVDVKEPNPDFEGLFRQMVRNNLGGLVTDGSPIMSFHRGKVLQLAERHRIPAIHSGQSWANNGGLMTYGPNRADTYRRVAVYVDKILKGTKPADIPVEQPLKFDLVINLKAAKQIGVNIAPEVMARANRLIR